MPKIRIHRPFSVILTTFEGEPGCLKRLDLNFYRSLPTLGGVNLQKLSKDGCSGFFPSFI